MAQLSLPSIEAAAIKAVNQEDLFFYFIAKHDNT